MRERIPIPHFPRQMSARAFTRADTSVFLQRRLESIDGVTLGAGPHERLETTAIRYVYSTREQVSQVLFDTNILEQANKRFGRKLDEDIDITVGFFFATRD
jgi:hypothetical protein